MPGVFLNRLAPNGQRWQDYCGPAPPTSGGEGRLSGAWLECMRAAVVFEITNPEWESMPGYQDTLPSFRTEKASLNCVAHNKTNF